MSTPADPPAHATGTLRIAVALLVLQAVAVTAITIFLVYADLSTAGADQKLAWAVTGLAVLGAALLALLARGVSRHQRWARDVAVAVQMLLLAPAYYMIAGGMVWLGVLVGGVSLAVIALLVAPQTNRALGVL